MHADRERLDHGAFVKGDVVRQLVGEAGRVHDRGAQAAVAGLPRGVVLQVGRVVGGRSGPEPQLAADVVHAHACLLAVRVRHARLHADAVAHAQVLDVCTDLRDHTRALVAEDHRLLDNKGADGPMLVVVDVRAADAHAADVDADVVGREGFVHINLAQIQLALLLQHQRLGQRHFPSRKGLKCAVTAAAVLFFLGTRRSQLCERVRKWQWRRSTARRCRTFAFATKKVEVEVRARRRNLWPQFRRRSRAGNHPSIHRQEMSSSTHDEEDDGVLRVGGVPEHFNLPWHHAEEKGFFARYGVKVKFTDIKEGTGAMIQALKDGRVDLIIALTEGLVADIAKGSDLRLVGTYVQSPLCWAVSTGATSSIQTLADLEGKTFGVSRMGSGSHLMALVLATQRGWERPPQFKVVGSFENLRNSVNSGETDAFMWETFTTKPFHDSGEVRRVGDITTPWPCFMVAGRAPVIGKKHAQVQAALAAVSEAAFEFRRDVYGMPRELARRYELREEDAQKWYRAVDIAAVGVVSESALTSAIAALKDGGSLPRDLHVDPAALVAAPFCVLHNDIKSMGLYAQTSLLQQLRRKLAAAGRARGPLPFAELTEHDIHIYHKAAGIERAVRLAGIRDGSQVINVGAGLGGVARYLAHNHACKVLASELQDDLHQCALELTQRVNLAQQPPLEVDHRLGDFVEVAGELLHCYDHIVSFLTVLHFANRPALYKRCFETLRPGGSYFAADFFLRRSPTEEERWTLENRVGCPGLAGSLQIYRDEIVAAGFTNVELYDVTEDWTQFAVERSQSFTENATALRALLHDEVYTNLKGFFDTIADLFRSGCIGGVEVVGRRHLGW
eukprot:m.113208 g.113208  ORF g.113208 m.113208 type:complete len:844 (+) comp15994_c2_seq2:1106-3637(+)